MAEENPRAGTHLVLRVYYDGKGNSSLDEAIGKALQSFGYQRWASGYNLIDNSRDLAFDKEV